MLEDTEIQSHEIEQRSDTSALIQAFEILFKDYQQVFADVIGFRTDECQECYDEYETCMREAGYDGAQTLGNYIITGERAVSLQQEDRELGLD